MKLTCPECSTQFLIQSEAIGANGRTVRCSQCSATWFVAAEPDVMQLQDTIDNVKARADYVRGVDVTPELADTPDLKPEKISQNSGAIKETAAVAATTLAPHTALRDRAEKKRVRRRLFGVGMIWVVTLAILTLMAVMAFLFRSQIVEKFPVTRQMYKGFGIEASATGLEIYGIDTRFGESDGTTVLFVDGKVKNYDVKARDVGLMKLSFKNASGEVINSWVVELTKPRLEAGETMQFSSQYPNPPPDAATLSPSFVNESVD